MEIPTKPYLLRAIYEWCTDNGFTPYIAVRADSHAMIPRQFIRDGQITLNISYDATSNLVMDNEVIEFKARFGGVSHDIRIPVDNVMAIYASENGQGMAFEVTERKEKAPDDDPEPPKKGGRPILTRVK